MKVPTKEFLHKHSDGSPNRTTEGEKLGTGSSFLSSLLRRAQPRKDSLTRHSDDDDDDYDYPPASSTLDRTVISLGKSSAMLSEGNVMHKPNVIGDSLHHDDQPEEEVVENIYDEPADLFQRYNFPPPKQDKHSVIYDDVTQSSEDQPTHEQVDTTAATKSDEQREFASKVSSKKTHYQKITFIAPKKDKDGKVALSLSSGNDSVVGPPTQQTSSMSTIVQKLPPPPPPPPPPETPSPEPIPSPPLESRPLPPRASFSIPSADKPSAPITQRTPPSPTTSFKVPPSPSIPLQTPPSPPIPLQTPPSPPIPLKTPPSPPIPLQTPPSPPIPLQTPPSPPIPLKTPPSPPIPLKTPPSPPIPLKTLPKAPPSPLNPLQTSSIPLKIQPLVTNSPPQFAKTPPPSPPRAAKAPPPSEILNIFRNTRAATLSQAEEVLVTPSPPSPTKRPRTNTSFPNSVSRSDPPASKSAHPPVPKPRKTKTETLPASFASKPPIDPSSPKCKTIDREVNNSDSVLTVKQKIAALAATPPHSPAVANKRKPPVATPPTRSKFNNADEDNQILMKLNQMSSPIPVKEEELPQVLRRLTMQQSSGSSSSMPEVGPKPRRTPKRSEPPQIENPNSAHQSSPVMGSKRAGLGTKIPVPGPKPIQAPVPGPKPNQSPIPGPKPQRSRNVLQEGRRNS